MNAEKMMWLDKLKFAVMLSALLVIIATSFFGVEKYLDRKHMDSIFSESAIFFDIPDSKFSGKVIEYDHYEGWDYSVTHVSLRNNFSVKSLKGFCDSNKKLNTVIIDGVTVHDLELSESVLSKLSGEEALICIGKGYDQEAGRTLRSLYITPSKTLLWLDVV